MNEGVYGIDGIILKEKKTRVLGEKAVPTPLWP
jgi:hypothetical protein